MLLVTGGNRGIGLACARAFAALGDRVAVTSRSGEVEVSLTAEATLSPGVRPEPAR